MPTEQNKFLPTWKPFLVSLIWLASCYHGFSQLSVSGMIRDHDSGKPMSGANISVEGTFSSTASDPNGQFGLRGLKPGYLTLKITYMGYQSIVQSFHLIHDTVVDFKLQHGAILGEEVNIIATRAQEETPMAYSTMNRVEIEKVNMGQDLPFIIENTPSVVVTSDAGNGIGYTGINIRGSDLTRINVTLNGIPLNDAESQGVWFVDLPDLASSTGTIQVQRGVGTSTNGAGAFGASVNIQSSLLSPSPYAELSSTAGSFNTFKNTFRFGTGLIKERFSFDGRISRITSDGYIDRAFAKLTSFSISGGYFGRKTTVKFNVLSGYEKTYQAWEGVPKDSLSTNRTYNPAGEYLDKNGNLKYYDNQTDNYTQTHYQLLFSQAINPELNINAALHYTKGYGYYENYDAAQSFSDYNLDNVIIGQDTITMTDLINQKWIDNDFYGLTFSGNYQPLDRLKITLGGAWNQYSGKHYGKVTWAEFASNGNNFKEWYHSRGLKTDFNIFAKASYRVHQQVSLFADIQYRYVYHSMDGTLEDLRTLNQTHKFNFFNPKAGIYFNMSDKQDLYLSFAISNREPNRNNYEVSEPGNIPTNETVNDLELGYDLRLANFNAGVNLYCMNYHNQLVLTGKINSVGEAIMTNVPHSYRAGIEITAGANLFKWMKWEFNSTFSMNKIKDFREYTDCYDSSWNLTGQISKYIGSTDLSFSPNIILQNNLIFIPAKDLSFTLNSRYVGKQFIDNTSNSDRILGSYFLNNVIVMYTIKTKWIREIRFSLMANNIFSEKYETNAWTYPYYQDGASFTSNGYFPQALINFLFGITLKI